MQAHIHAWEPMLLSMAHEAHTFHHDEMARVDVDRRDLDRAYEYCDALTALHSRSFYVASSLLPKEKRSAVRALYAFCRVTDDIVDSGDANAASELAAWQARTAATLPSHDDLVALAWADARARFSVPQRYAEQLVAGVAQDLHKSRYDTFDELAAYSYGVASTVGLMSMHIIGYSSPEAIRYAIKLGVALQMTNILRDVGEDWRRGRVYLPAEDLNHFGLSTDDIAAGRVTSNWRRFMRYQIERNRQLYAEALPGIALLAEDGRFAIRAAADLYRAILYAVETNDYDVFSKRAHISALGKVLRLPSVWLQAKRASSPV
ncbi:MAG: squalene/phytoene synthase family protein [Chloroflexota bacterium]|nr:squalene/phytoene synthase family protein [Chloroflexota bacterium]